MNLQQRAVTLAAERNFKFDKDQAFLNDHRNQNLKLERNYIVT